jgi:hypothetical protein
MLLVNKSEVETLFFGNETASEYVNSIHEPDEMNEKGATSIK